MLSLRCPHLVSSATPVRRSASATVHSPPNADSRSHESHSRLGLDDMAKFDSLYQIQPITGKACPRTWTRQQNPASGRQLRALSHSNPHIP